VKKSQSERGCFATAPQGGRRGRPTPPPDLCLVYKYHFFLPHAKLEAAPFSSPPAPFPPPDFLSKKER